jgi:hypothetical protein
VHAAVHEPRHLLVHLLVRREQDVARHPAGRVDEEIAGLARVSGERRQRQHAIEVDDLVDKERDEVVREEWIRHRLTSSRSAMSAADDDGEPARPQESDRAPGCAAAGARR